MYSPGNADVASLFYSVGFADRIAGAEIAIFGVDPDSGSSLLADADEQLNAGTLTLEDKAVWDVDWGDVGTVRLTWRAVHPSQIIAKYFDAAIAYNDWRERKTEDLKAFQLVFPDERGKFPWEDGYDLEYRPWQHELYLSHDLAHQPRP